jgi:hypothetical protein
MKPDDDLEPIELADSFRTGSSTSRWVAVLAVVVACFATAVAVHASSMTERLADRVAELEHRATANEDSATLTSLVRRTDRLNEEVTSLGTRTVRVPDVVGMQVHDALNWIGVAGFPAGAAPPTGGLDVDGRCVVVSQLPEGGARAQVVTPVRLSLSAPEGQPRVDCR